MCANNRFGFCQALFATELAYLWGYNVYTNAVESSLPVHFPQQLRVGPEIDALDTHMPVFQFRIGIVITLLFYLFGFF